MGIMECGEEINRKVEADMEIITHLFFDSKEEVPIMQRATVMVEVEGGVGITILRIKPLNHLPRLPTIILPTDQVDLLHPPNVQTLIRIIRTTPIPTIGVLEATIHIILHQLHMEAKCTPHLRNMEII